MGSGVRRPGAAARRRQRLHRRCVRRPAHCLGRHRGARADRTRVRRGVPGREAGPRRVGPRVRQRPGARRGRNDLRAGGQPARAVRRVVHAREPGDHQGRVRRAVCRAIDPARRRLPRPAPANARIDRGQARTDDRRADPRHLQLGLLRALVPRTGDGCRTRRGQRPRGDRRRGVPAHVRRARAGRRAVSPSRRFGISTRRCSIPNRCWAHRG